LKTRQKLRDNEKKKIAKDLAKKEKDAKAAEAGGAKKPKKVEEEVDPTKYTENRKNYLDALR
jgi:lysyl-tRNA synthetase class 2